MVGPGTSQARPENPKKPVRFGMAGPLAFSQLVSLKPGLGLEIL